MAEDEDELDQMDVVQSTMAPELWVAMGST